eukprot:955164_1
MNKKNVRGQKESSELVAMKFSVMMTANIPLIWHSELDDTSRRRVNILLSRYKFVCDPDPFDEFQKQKIPNLNTAIKTEQNKEYMMRLLMENAHVVINSATREPFIAPEVIQDTAEYFEHLPYHATHN